MLTRALRDIKPRPPLSVYRFKEDSFVEPVLFYLTRNSLLWFLGVHQ